MAQEQKSVRVQSVLEQSWRERMAAWRESGQSQQAFCRDHGLSASVFSRWKYKLARRDESTEASAVVVQVGAIGSAPEERPDATGWTEVRLPAAGAEVVPATPESSGFEIILPWGWSVRLGPRFEADSLRCLLAVLEERSC